LTLSFKTSPKTRHYATIKALQVDILNKIQYEKVEYSSYETDPSSAEIENFVNQFDSNEPLEIVRFLQIINDKIQRLTKLVIPTLRYSMTNNSSAY